MTLRNAFRMRAMTALAIAAIGLGASSAWGDEPSAMNYAFSMPRIWKSSAKDTGTTTSPVLQPKVVWTPSNFSRFLGLGDGETPAVGKAVGGRPWEQFRKSAPGQRWRPLAPVEEERLEPVTDVALRFPDEGAVMRMYR